MRRKLWLLLFLSALGAAREFYQPTTESLRRHKAPAWFEDAKFGIFIHWGPYAVAGFHEWYVDYMSPRANYGFLLGGPPYTAEQGLLPDELFARTTIADAVEYHRKRWGADFPYDNFLPLFRAERFDPQAWARFFEEAGARYVVFTAKHGDEFAMWPSQHTRRNAMEMGPRRDLAGELLKAVRARGLKMGFYHNTTYTFWDPRYPGRDWVAYMNASIKELVDLYQPDILWGDVLEGPVRDRHGRTLTADYWGSKEVLAYFYNRSPDPSQVCANDRWGLDVDGKPLGDFRTPERRNYDRIVLEKWELCDSLDPFSWGYRELTPRGMYLTANQVVDYLVDVVSKNGNLLMNIGPRADGTIPEVMVEALRGVGEWLRINGEAIYGTRPWRTFRDGDVRYTQKGRTLYAIALEWPEEELRLAALAGEKVTRVELLGSSEALEWKQEASGLTIRPPRQRPCRYAYAFKIQLAP
ncbi:MAG: alpha-L-fucosidase [Bryobacterales bacterium]|nr:alpha-L-fucosidase [Bryobacteraceae bacterium]MDW8355372.1 alpha-L-fucosidase [Bryobacterales bacterium]